MTKLLLIVATGFSLSAHGSQYSLSVPAEVEDCESGLATPALTGEVATVAEFIPKHLLSSHRRTVNAETFQLGHLKPTELGWAQRPLIPDSFVRYHSKVGVNSRIFYVVQGRAKVSFRSKVGDRAQDLPFSSNLLLKGDVVFLPENVEYLIQPHSESVTVIEGEIGNPLQSENRVANEADVQPLTRDIPSQLRQRIWWTIRGVEAVQTQFSVDDPLLDTSAVAEVITYNFKEKWGDSAPDLKIKKISIPPGKTLTLDDPSQRYFIVVSGSGERILDGSARQLPQDIPWTVRRGQPVQIHSSETEAMELLVFD